MRNYFFILFFLLFSSVSSATNIFSEVYMTRWSGYYPPTELFDSKWETPQVFPNMGYGYKHYVEWFIPQPVGLMDGIVVQLTEEYSVGQINFWAFEDYMGEFCPLYNPYMTTECDSQNSQMIEQNSLPSLLIGTDGISQSQHFRAEFIQADNVSPVVTQIYGYGNALEYTIPEPSGLTIVLILTCWFILRR